MSDKVTETAMQERTALNSAAARVPLAPESSARVARAVTPTVTRFTAAGVSLAFEIEPSSFTVIARAEIHE
jgi:hypothetical protein